MSKCTRVGALVAVLLLAGGLVGTPPALAGPAAGFVRLKPQEYRSVPGSKPPAAPARPADATAAAARTAPPAVTWPAAGSAVVNVAAPRPDIPAPVPVRAGSLPVLVSGASAAGSVRIEVLDHAAAVAAGQPLLVRISGEAAPSKVRVSVDYIGFRQAFGADWANRLRLVQLPGCAATTPAAPGCQTATQLVSFNNAAAHTVSADIATSPSGVLLAASSGPSGSTGDFTATPFAASSSWQAGGSSGDFTWSYPMRVPPAPAGPAPSVSLSYSAQSVDGHTAASNNQPSWVGEGFDYQPGSISRSYKACAEDMGGTASNTTKTGDLCWGTDNAALSLPGHSGELVKDDGTGTWRLKHDDGSRIERLTGGSNGDNNGESWKLTSIDGTQYFFGLNKLPGWAAGRPTTNSAWTVPVYGNNPQEPCQKATFDTSWCYQAWQWNLDYVVDPHGNTMSLWYTTETNNYTRNNTASTVSTYTRAGHIDHIDYGTDNRSGSDSDYTGHAPMSVVFGTADRCQPNTTCILDTAHAANWPDTPVDQNCSSTTSCPTVYAPTFWSQKRLASVTTRVWDSGAPAPRDVERWTLTHSYPDPGDSTRAGLWLNRISHAGLVGGTATVPDVTFTGVQKPNRVDTPTDQSPAMNWWRISYITTETGGIIGVTYTDPQCVAGSHMPASPDSNTMRCYPVYWTRPGNSDPTVDWFHKYVVRQVTETDSTGGAPRVITSYTYPGPAAWHYSSDTGLVPPARRTWADWRGYDRVEVTTGDPGSQTFTVNRFFRGMNGDHLASGGTRSVSVDGTPDDDAFAGMARESVAYNGPGGPEVTESATTPWQSTPTATRTAAGTTVTARHTGIGVATTRTALDGGRAPRTTTVTTTFDNTYGYPIQVADAGDDARTDDDRCTITSYANNTTAWIIGRPARVQNLALACGKTPADEDDVITDIRTSYDNQPAGTAPVRGDVTQTETTKAWPNPSAITWLTTSKAGYDAAGRATDTWDVRGNHTTTAFTPTLGGPVTAVSTTNVLGWTDTAKVEPAWGKPTVSTDVNGLRTEGSYDPLGRLTAVWLPGRNRAANDGPNTTYAYTMSTNAPAAVTTARLDPNGHYQTGYQLYDALLRPRQTQAPAANGTGRVLTDTFYDTAGRVAKTNAPYYNTDTGPGVTLFTPQDNQVPSQTVTSYDGAGRVTASILKSNAVEQWRTTTSYGGDHTDVTQPAGGTPTSSVVDVRGHTTQLRQYHGRTPSGDADTTTYTYNRKGQLAQLADTANNQWTWTYDLLGRTIGQTDPDSGATTSSYNDAGDLLTRTDARHATVAYGYDSLGRRTGEFDTSTSGTRLASWTYDTTLLPDGVTPARGQPSSSTRYVAGNAYSFTMLGYTSRYAATGQSISIPAVENRLAGTYAFTSTFNADGSPNSIRYSPTAGLPAETVSFGYDQTTGFPVSLSSSYGGIAGTYVIDARYTPMGDPTITTFSTGGSLAQQGLYYDPVTNRRTEAITVKETAPSFVADLNYTYDPAGNITKIADTPAGGTADTQCFTNDYLGRLTQAWTPASGDCKTTPTTAGLGGPAPYWQSWTLNAVGNRLTQTDHASGGDTTTTYTYDANQPHTATGATVAGPTGTRTSGYVYNEAGDTTSRPAAHGQQTLTWDLEGHLATVTDTAGTNSYVYAPDGSRLISRDPTGTTLELGPVTLRLNQSNGAVTATRYYAFNGSVVAQRTTGGVTWLMSDHHGTDQIAIDAASQAVTQRRFKPYGEPRGTTVPWVNDKGYLHGTADPTGLTHLGAREYDPGIGRFISPDPLLDTRNPQQINGYSYCGNSPVTMADPSGLMQDMDQTSSGTNQSTTNVDGVPLTYTYDPKTGNTTVTVAGIPVKKYFGTGKDRGADWVVDDPYEFAKEVAKQYAAKHGGDLTLDLLNAMTTACVQKDSHAGCDPNFISDLRTYALMRIAARDGCDAACFEKAHAADGAAAQIVVDSGNGVGRLAGGKAPRTGSVFEAEGALNEMAQGKMRPRLCANSFDGRTPVLMADGHTKPIDQINVGDEVVATDPGSQTTGPHAVVALHLNWDVELTDLIVVDGRGHPAVLHTTLHHPFWDETAKAWVDAGQLRPGDRLHTGTGAMETVVVVHSFFGVRSMYNLTVDAVHTYYVIAGTTPVLVHNTGGCGQNIENDLNGLPTGKQSHVRTVRTEDQLEGLYDKWSEGGTDITPTGYNGEMVRLPDGTIVGLRSASKSGGATIDIKLPDGTVQKVHIDGP